MEHPELAISIMEFNGTPIMALSGTMDVWHEPIIDVALESLVETTERELILDLARLEFNGADAIGALLKSLRQLSPATRIHAVANSQLVFSLQKANLGSCISLSTSLTEIADGVRQEERYLTSRWTPNQVEEEELPLAA